jgi:hypothetical protein
MEGLKFLKAQRPDLALEHLATARSFDKNSAKICIARGCALANMVTRRPSRTTSTRGSGKSKRHCASSPTTRRHSATSKKSARKWGRRIERNRRRTAVGSWELATTTNPAGNDPVYVINLS